MKPKVAKHSKPHLTIAVPADHRICRQLVEHFDSKAAVDTLVDGSSGAFRLTEKGAHIIQANRKDDGVGLFDHVRGVVVAGAQILNFLPRSEITDKAVTDNPPQDKFMGKVDGQTHAMAKQVAFVLKVCPQGYVEYLRFNEH